MMKMKGIKIFLAVAVLLSLLNHTTLAVSAYDSQQEKTTSFISKKRQNYDLQWLVNPGSESLVHVTIENQEINYSYNEDNNRISKQVGDNIVSYTYQNKKLLSETREGNLINYLYDDYEMISGFKLNEITYFYVKDQDLNIIAITDAEGLEVARYIYDSNGIVSSILGQDDAGAWVDFSDDGSFAGTLNLIRLHSFYYDQETSWYYNGSR